MIVDWFEENILMKHETCCPQIIDLYLPKFKRKKKQHLVNLTAFLLNQVCTYRHVVTYANRKYISRRVCRKNDNNISESLIEDAV